MNRSELVWKAGSTRNAQIHWLRRRSISRGRNPLRVFTDVKFDETFWWDWLVTVLHGCSRLPPKPEVLHSFPAV